MSTIRVEWDPPRGSPLPSVGGTTAGVLVELMGIEPTASGLQNRRSPS